MTKVERNYTDKFSKEIEMFAEILDKTEAHLAWLDPEFNFVWVNSTYAKGSGHTVEELIGKNHFDLFPNEENQALFKKVINTGQPIEFKAKPFVYADQPERGVTYWDWTLSPIKSKSGKILGLVLSLFDVTQRIRAEIAMRENEEKFKTLAENAPDIIARIDKNLRHIYINPIIEQITGIAKDNYLGKNLEELGMPEHLCRLWNKALRAVFLTGKPKKIEYDIPSPKGIKSFQTHIAPEVNEKGEIKSVMIIARDVTDIKQAAEQYETILRTTLDGFLITDIKGQFLDVNEAYCQLIGYSREELMTMKVSDIEAVESAEETAEHIKKIIKMGGDRFETRHRCKNGKIVDIEVSVNFLDLAAGRFFVFLRDMTGRKRTAKALLEREEWLSKTQEIAHLGSWELDLVNNRLSWSDEVYRIFGLRPQEFGASYEAFLESVHPDDRAAVDAAYSGSLREGKDSYEIEHRVIRKSTGEIRIVHEKCEHIRDDSGRIIRSVGMVHDITEQKEIEERKLREIQLQVSLKELENIASLFDTVNVRAIIQVNSKGTVKYLNERARNLLRIKEGDEIDNYFNLAKFSTDNFVNEIIYSEKEKAPFLVSREQYKKTFLFLVEPIKKAVEKSRKMQTTLAPYHFDDIIGLNVIKRRAKNLALQEVNFLLQGESGTGKELLASSIHNASPRAGRRFVVVNCAAIPETLFESELFGYKKGAFTDARTDRMGKIEYASGGTLFLDEIGDLPLHFQSKLLRVLEDKNIIRLGGPEPIKIDVRFIFATNRNLEEMVNKNQFRKDLYYRINLPVINIPPLRERKDEIPDLINYFLIKFKQIHSRFVTGISDEAIERLLAYDYPGNVRELEGILKDAYLSCRSEIIEFKDLKLAAPKRQSLSEKIKDYKAQLVYEQFLIYNRDIEKTAKALNLSSRQIYRYLNQKIGNR